MIDQQSEYFSPESLSDEIVNSEASAFVSNDVIRDVRIQTRNETLQPSTYEQSFQIASRQEQIIYDQKGLEYASNLPFINKRDAAGNLIITGTVQQVTDDEAEQYNETVIIEAIDRLYTNRSINRIVDTQFKYFKFPPTIITRQNDIGEIDIQLPDNELDIFSARYTPDFVQQWFIFAPSYAVSGKAHGFQKLEFNNVLRGPQQIESGTYTITPELIESGKNLRMRYKIAVHFANPDLRGNLQNEIQGINDDINRISTLIKSYQNTLQRTTNPQNAVRLTQQIIDLNQQIEDLRKDLTSVNQRIGFKARFQRKSADYQPPLQGNEAAGVANYITVPSNGYDTISGEYVIENRTMQAWDKWYIEGMCGTNDILVNGQTKGGLYFADQSYWEIEAVDP